MALEDYLMVQQIGEIIPIVRRRFSASTNANGTGQKAGNTASCRQYLQLIVRYGPHSGSKLN